MPKLSEYDLRPGDWVIVEASKMPDILLQQYSTGTWEVAELPLPHRRHCELGAECKIAAAYRPSYKIEQVFEGYCSSAPLTGMILEPLKPREEKPSLMTESLLEMTERAEKERDAYLKRAEAAEKERDELEADIECQLTAAKQRAEAAEKELRTIRESVIKALGTFELKEGA